MNNIRSTLATVWRIASLFSFPTIDQNAALRPSERSTKDNEKGRKKKKKKKKKTKSPAGGTHPPAWPPPRQQARPARPDPNNRPHPPSPPARPPTADRPPARPPPPRPPATNNQPTNPQKKKKNAESAYCGAERATVCGQDDVEHPQLEVDAPPVRCLLGEEREPLREAVPALHGQGHRAVIVADGSRIRSRALSAAVEPGSSRRRAGRADARRLDRDLRPDAGDGRRAGHRSRRARLVPRASG